MKKIIAISMVAVSFVATTAFSQGYLQFTGSKGSVYDGFTTAGTSATAATVDVAFLWAAASTTPTVDGYLTSTPTAGNNLTTENYSAAQAWSAILNGQFTLAQNAAGSTTALTTTAANGGFSYNGGFSFGITGTTPGTIYTLYAISWNGTYATPSLAAAAGAAVGWSAPVQFTLYQATDQTITAPSFGTFGTFIPAITPEPTTIALAGLGGLSLLLVRRKK